MEKVPMTADGASALREELNRLKSTERPRIVQEISEALEQGDLRENAEYQYAKEEQGLITLLNVNTDDEVTYQIVGDDEADITKNKISVYSPVARGLITKEEGDSVIIQTPSGPVEYEILTIEHL